MNTSLPLKTLLCLISFPLLIQGQIPENFEFLAHDAKHNEISQLIVREDHIIFSTNNGFHRASYNYDIENFYARQDFAQSKLIDENDSTYYFFTYDRSDHDIVGIPGFTVMTNQSGEDAFSVIGERENIHIQDVIVDSIGGYWCLRSTVNSNSVSTGILHFENDTLSTVIDHLFQRPKLYKNSRGDIYVFDSSSSINHITGNEFEYDSIYEFADDIKLWGDNNLIIDGNQAILTTPDFKQRLDTWDLPFRPISFENVTINLDSSLYLVNLQLDSYEIFHVDKSSNSQLLYAGQTEDNETIKGVKTLSDSTHLVYGQHQFEIVNNTFFRMIHHHKDLVYERTDVDLLSVNLFPTDTIDFGYFEISGEASIEYQNNDNEVITHLNAISTSIDDPYSFLNFPISTEIQPGTSLVDIHDFRFLSRELDFSPGFLDTKFEISGANFRFNKSTQKVASVDLVSAVKEAPKLVEVPLYPNPTLDVIHWQQPDIVKSEIYNGQGQRILINENIGSHQDVSSLESGTYLLILTTTAGRSYSGVFVKQ